MDDTDWQLLIQINDQGMLYLNNGGRQSHIGGSLKRAFSELEAACRAMAPRSFESGPGAVRLEFLGALEVPVCR